MSTRTAEEWAQVAAHQAQRATQKADAATNAALAAQQTVSRFERELSDLRREMNDGFAELANTLRNLQYGLRGASGPTRETRTSLTHEDFNPTETGSHYICTRDTVQTVLEEREMKLDAGKWRAMWRRVRGFVWTAAGAGGALLVEQLLQRLLHH